MSWISLVVAVSRNGVSLRCAQLRASEGPGAAKGKCLKKGKLNAWHRRLSQVERLPAFISSVTNHFSQSKHSARQERLRIKQQNLGACKGRSVNKLKQWQLREANGMNQTHDALKFIVLAAK